MIAHDLGEAAKPRNTLRSIFRQMGPHKAPFGVPMFKSLAPARKKDRSTWSGLSRAWLFPDLPDLYWRGGVEREREGEREQASHNQNPGK